MRHVNASRGRARSGPVTRWAVCLTLAYALFLQAALGAAAGTMHALSMADGGTVDAEMGVLCAPSGQADKTDGDTSHDLLCCTLGCAAAQPAPSLGGSAPLSLPAPPQAAQILDSLTPSAVWAGAISPAFEARGPPARA